MTLFKRVLLAVLCISFVLGLSAQNDYETWKSQQKSEMKKHISEQDEAFATFLETEKLDRKVKSYHEIRKHKKAPSTSEHG